MSIAALVSADISESDEGIPVNRVLLLLGTDFVPGVVCLGAVDLSCLSGLT